MVPNEWRSTSVYRRGSGGPGGDSTRTVVVIRGDHDVATRGDLSRAMAEAADLDDGDVVVDLSGVTFLDASTIGVVVDGYNRLRAASRSLSVRAPSSLARRLFEVCELAFLIEEGPPLAGGHVAPALESWVAVPASDRTSRSAQPPATRPDPASEPARPATPRRVERAASVEQRPPST